MQKAEKVKLINLSNLTVNILQKKFSYHGPLGLPYYIEITGNSHYESGVGYRYKLLYVFKNNYMNKPGIDYTYDWTATTDKQENLIKETIDIILQAIIDWRKEYSNFDKFIYVKQDIPGGQRIIIDKKNGS
ncbi:MAG: hypothetical protein PHF86_10700 [Candidatus Nanoarchaeia archaeon]|nr:hypothetical protein [Candidatus Nanoarchaeia archaeon]